MSRPVIDWESMEPEWRIGLKSVLQLSKDFGVSRAAIIKHWDKEGIDRDLSAKINARAGALVTKSVVTPEVTQNRRKTEKAVVEASATMIADKVINQRTDIQRARSIAQKLWALVDAELDHPAEMDALGEMMAAPDEFGQDKLSDMYRAAIGLPQQIKNVKLLADALKVLIELERKVLKVDDHDGKPVSDALSDLIAAIGSSPIPVRRHV